MKRLWRWAGRLAAWIERHEYEYAYKHAEPVGVVTSTATPTVRLLHDDGIFVDFTRGQVHTWTATTTTPYSYTVRLSTS